MFENLYMSDFTQEDIWAMMPELDYIDYFDFQEKEWSEEDWDDGMIPEPNEYIDTRPTYKILNDMFGNDCAGIIREYFIIPSKVPKAVLMTRVCTELRKIIITVSMRRKYIKRTGHSALLYAIYVNKVSNGKSSI